MQFQFGYDRPPTKPQFDPELTDLDVYMSSSHCTGVALQRGIFKMVPAAGFRRVPWRKDMTGKRPFHEVLSFKLINAPVGITITSSLASSKAAEVMTILDVLYQSKMSAEGDSKIAEDHAALPSLWRHVVSRISPSLPSKYS